MSLLKDLVNEMAAGGSTSAGSVAGGNGSLFGGGSIDTKKVKEKQRIMMRRLGSFPVKKSMIESLGVDLGKSSFDASDVISKLDAAEKSMRADKDTTAFGMEDDQGNLVKVYVRNDQAEEFEHALSAMLDGADEDDDDRNSNVEIAEVLYKLKDKYEIVEVEWPSIEGDEEEEQEVEGGEEGAEGEGKEGEVDMEASVQKDPEDGDLDGEMNIDAEVGAEGEMDDGGDDMEAATSALTQVIDMMKADSQAKEAEAKAREAEANAKEAEYASKTAESKVRQEEEILDMETHNKAKSDQDKEAKTLAQLAKYKHDIKKSRTDDQSVSAVKVTKEEEEEVGNDAEPWRTRPEESEDKELTKAELTSLIFQHLRSN